MLLLLVSMLAALGLSAQSPNGDTEKQNPFAGSIEAIEAGRQTFVETCSACHGVNGEGGRGPSLVGRFVRRLSDQQLFNSVQKGVPGTDMPPLPLPDDKIWRLTAFVRGLAAPAFEHNPRGNAGAGRELFFGAAGCSACHMIRGQGGFLGPDLSDAGSQRTFGQLREALLDPSARVADGFEAVVLEAPGGRETRGVAKYRTNYSMRVLDESGKMHAIRGKAIERVRLVGKSWMPSGYGERLTEGQIQDLLAFLSRQSIRGRSNE